MSVTCCPDLFFLSKTNWAAVLQLQYAPFLYLRESSGDNWTAYIAALPHFYEVTYFLCYFKRLARYSLRKNHTVYLRMITPFRTSGLTDICRPSVSASVSRHTIPADSSPVTFSSFPSAPTPLMSSSVAPLQL